MDRWEIPCLEQAGVTKSWIARPRLESLNENEEQVGAPPRHALPGALSVDTLPNSALI